MSKRNIYEREREREGTYQGEQFYKAQRSTDQQQEDTEETEK